MTDLHLIAVGDFGGVVSELLTERYNAVTTRDPQIVRDTSRWPRARIQVVVAWRETPALFEAADRYANWTHRPWLPVVLDATSLRIGPLVTGAGGPCYRCFLGRQFQHRQLLDADRDLFRAYDADPEVGVGGYLAAHVTIAVHATSTVIDAMLGDGTECERGRVRTFGLLDARMTNDRVIPVHGCERCCPSEPDATWKRLAHDMESASGPTVVRQLRG